MHRRSGKTSFSLVKVSIISVLIILLIVLTYFGVTYNALQKSKTAGFQSTKDHVLDQTDIIQIHHVETFQEMDTYHIVFGKTAEDIEQVIFVPISNPDKALTIVDKADIIGKEVIETEWSSHCEQCKLVSIKPAMLSHTPLWELTYYDGSNRYVFDYVSMNDGSSFEKIRLQREFK